MNGNIRQATLIALIVVAQCAAAEPASTKFTERFDQLPVGKAPHGWRIAATNPTAALATWEVRADASAPSRPNVMSLTASKNYDGTFNLAIAEEPRFADLDLTVRVKAVAGKEDQGGGPIWRCQDENNYYICRFNPLESNFRVYVVSNGKRRQLETVKVELAADRWYEVHIRMQGDDITCELDGKTQLKAHDETIRKAGRIGLWTKADAVTSFDDLRVEALAAKPAPTTQPATAKPTGKGR